MARVALVEPDEVILYFERFFDDPSPWLITFDTAPMLESLHDFARFIGRTIGEF